MQKQEDDFNSANAVSKLNQLDQLISQQSSQSQQYFRAYVQIYIRMNTLQEECFMSLCEHQIIQKLFGAQGRSMGHLLVLQLFNLILANTNQTNSLVYIFSQPSLHQYLFQKFSIEESVGQVVEYYVQLLKTIVYKINNGHGSLIKLFCNNKYSSFPLLCQTTFLATRAAEELVRVTARQCVLVLVGLLIRKKVGEGYLVEVQMGLFFHELTLQASEGEDMDGSLNYVVDLICVLQNNNVSLAMLMNCFTINVVMSRHQDLAGLLNILHQWSGLLEDHQELPPIIALQLRLIIYRMVCKLFFGQFINATYLSAYNNCSKISSQQLHSLVDLRKFFRQRFQRLSNFLKDFDEPIDYAKESSSIMLGWAQFLKNAEPQSLKRKQQKKSGLLRLFSSKTDPVEMYIKRSLECGGFNIEQGKIPLFRVSQTINYPTAFFTIERLLVREQMQKGESPFEGFEQYEVFYNDNRGIFKMNESLCDSILYILKRLKGRGIQISNKQIQRQQLGQGEPQYVFLRQLRIYIACHICDYILQLEKQSACSMRKISQVLRSLKVGYNLQKTAVKKLLWKLQQIQAQIHQVTFQSDFKGLIRYVLNEQKQVLMKEEFNEDICRRAYHYELLASVIEGSILSMTQFVQRQWETFINLQSNKNKLRMSTSQYDYQVDIIATSGLQFQVSIGKEGEEVKTVNARQSGTLRNILQTEVVAKQKEGQQNHLAGDVARFCAQRQQVLTKAIVQYFQQTYNRLCDSLSKSGIRQ